MTKIEIVSQLKGKEKPVITLGWFQKQSTKKNQKSLPPYYAGQLATEDLYKKLTQTSHFSGRREEQSMLHYYDWNGHEGVLLLGCGSLETWSPESARRVGAALSKAQKAQKIEKLCVDGSSLFNEESLTGSEESLNYWVQALCEGYHLGLYEHTIHKNKKIVPFTPKNLVIFGLDSAAELQKAAKKAQVVCESVYFARQLGDEPPNFLSPPLLAERIKKTFTGTAIKTTIFNKARIQKEKMGLLMGVGKGSTEDPRFIIMEYKGNASKKGHVALIGKGITFDTGGISLKPPGAMTDMKYDMMGSATVAGIMMALSKLKPKINVTGYIAAAENMPSAMAQKPSDVMRSVTGKTVEIDNTDAEGRLALADAIEYAQKSSPDAMIDFATLTGAVILALGTTTAGVMGNHQGLIEHLKASSEKTGERVWQLPLYDEFDKFFESTVADFKNSNNVREAGSSKGGTFLKFFVDKNIPWVHCDIAGSSMNGRGDRSYINKKYASAHIVRLMVDALENWNSFKK